MRAKLIRLGDADHYALTDADWNGGNFHTFIEIGPLNAEFELPDIQPGTTSYDGLIFDPNAEYPRSLIHAACAACTTWNCDTCKKTEAGHLVIRQTSQEIRDEIQRTHTGLEPMPCGHDQDLAPCTRCDTPRSRYCDDCPL